MKARQHVYRERYWRLLSSMGFRHTRRRHGSVNTLDVYEREFAGRHVTVQLWSDGDHRVSHAINGCSDTLPTQFKNVGQMLRAVLHELTRTDSKYYGQQPLKPF